MTRRNRENRLDDLEDAFGTDGGQGVSLPATWDDYVPPWRRGSTDEAMLFMLKAGYGDFDTSRDERWYRANAPDNAVKATDAKARERDQSETADNSADETGERPRGPPVASGVPREPRDTRIPR